MTIFSSRPRKVFLSPALVWLEEKGFSSARREAGVWEQALGVEVEEEGVMRMAMEAWKTMTIDHGGEDFVEKEGQGGGDQLKDVYSSYFPLSNCSFVLLYEKMKMKI